MARVASMKLIAEKLGCSINAVSLAINNKRGVSAELRRKVMKTAEEIGYFDDKPRYRPMYQKRTLCLLLHKIYFTASTFYSEIVIGIQERASELGYNIIIETFEDRRHPKLPESIVNRRASAVLVLGTVPDQMLEQLEELEIPGILIDHVSFSHDYDSIMTSNMEGTYQLADYLLKKGYKKFGFFGDMDYSVSIKERYMGLVHRLYREYEVRSYTEVIQELDESSVLYQIESYIVYSERERIWEAFQSIKEKPEVFLCSNDDAAAQLLLALHEHGVRVPEDIAICGFDDSSVAARMIPSITTMHIDKQTMGREAVSRLLWRMNNPDQEITRTSIRAHLVKRESC